MIHPFIPLEHWINSIDKLLVDVNVTKYMDINLF
jgi:hypothetical protein